MRHDNALNSAEPDVGSRVTPAWPRSDRRVPGGTDGYGQGHVTKCRTSDQRARRQWTGYASQSPAVGQEGAAGAGADTALVWVRDLDLPLYSAERAIPPAARQFAEAA